MTTDLAEQLRRKIQKKFEQSEYKGENPLFTVGLSPNILNLGFDDKELWDYCRAVSRLVIARFHPDRIGTGDKVIVEAQRRYATAFEALKDENLFMEALEEFRDLTKFERSEMNLLRRHNQSLGDMLNQFQQELEQVRAQARLDRQTAKDAAANIKDRYGKFVYYSGQKVHKHRYGLEHCSIYSCVQMLVLKISCTYIDQSIIVTEYDLDEITKQHAKLERLKQAGLKDKAKESKKTLMEIFRTSFGGFRDVDDIFDTALKSQTFFPIVRWSVDKALEHFGIKKPNSQRVSAAHELNLEQVRKFIAASSDIRFEQIEADYHCALREIQKFLRSIGAIMSDNLEVKLEICSVGDGNLKFESRGNEYTFRFIGTMRAEEFSPSMLHSKEKNARSKKWRVGTSEFSGVAKLEEILCAINPLAERKSLMIYSDLPPHTVESGIHTEYRRFNSPTFFINTYLLAMR